MGTSRSKSSRRHPTRWTAVRESPCGREVRHLRIVGVRQAQGLGDQRADVLLQVGGTAALLRLLPDRCDRDEAVRAVALAA